MLNWRKGATGEPRATETGMRGSERDGGKRSSNGTSPAVYSTAQASPKGQVSDFPARHAKAIPGYHVCSCKLLIRLLIGSTVTWLNTSAVSAGVEGPNERQWP